MATVTAPELAPGTLEASCSAMNGAGMMTSTPPRLPLNAPLPGAVLKVHRAGTDHFPETAIGVPIRRALLIPEVKDLAIRCDIQLRKLHRVDRNCRAALA